MQKVSLFLFMVLTGCRSAESLMRLAVKRDPNVVREKSVEKTIVTPAETKWISFRDSLKIDNERILIDVKVNDSLIDLFYFIKPQEIPCETTTTIVTIPEPKSAIRQREKTARKLGTERERTERTEKKETGKTDRKIAAEEQKTERKSSRSVWIWFISGLILGWLSLWSLFFLIYRQKLKSVR